MKIHNDVTHALQPTEKTSTARGVNSAGSTTTATAPVDSVSISDVSRTLQTTGVATEAPFDTNRVESIKAAISAGHFKVNPEAVADKVIESASQLLTGKS